MATSIVQRMTAALTSTEPKTPDPADVARLKELREQMRAVEGPPNRRDLLTLVEASLARNAEKIEIELRKAIERFGPRPPESMSLQQQAEQDLQLLDILFFEFGRKPREALAYILGATLLTNLKARLQRLDYAGADSPSLAERRDLRERLHREIVALERKTGVHERRALVATSSIAQVSSGRSVPK